MGDTEFHGVRLRPAAADRNGWRVNSLKAAQAGASRAFRASPLTRWKNQASVGLVLPDPC